MNFGEPDVHLAHSKASVILFFFGFNKSFADRSGLEAFKKEIRELIAHTQQQNYSGTGEPRIVLVSPIAFEKTGDKNLPSGDQHNTNITA